jgi:hypothetical protein
MTKLFLYKNPKVETHDYKKLVKYRVPVFYILILVQGDVNDDSGITVRMLLPNLCFSPSFFTAIDIAQSANTYHRSLACQFPSYSYEANSKPTK